MQIKPLLKKLKKLNLTPNQYFYLVGIATDSIKQVVDVVKATEIELLHLQEVGILTITNHTTLTFKWDESNIKLAKALLNSSEDMSWVSDWLDMWPEGIKSGGYYVKSSLKAVIAKMRAFTDHYDYPQDVIMESTRQYLEEMHHKGYTGIQISHNFIEKNGSSALEAYCRNYLKSPDHESRITHEAGVNI